MITAWQAVLIIYVVIINLVGFIITGVDKHKAKRHKWRVPEKSFFIIAALTGSVGVFSGMLFFRHKTKHWYFIMGIPAIFIIEAALVYFLLK